MNLLSNISSLKILTYVFSSMISIEFNVSRQSGSFERNTYTCYLPLLSVDECLKDSVNTWGIAYRSTTLIFRNMFKMARPWSSLIFIFL